MNSHHCSACKDGPGDFVIKMMLGSAWQQVVVPELPNLNLNSPEVQKLLSNIVWGAANFICLNDMIVEKVEIRESGIIVTPNLWKQPFVDHPEKYGRINIEAILENNLTNWDEQFGRKPLPDGVWNSLKKLSEAAT